MSYKLIILTLINANYSTFKAPNVKCRMLTPEVSVFEGIAILEIALRN